MPAYTATDKTNIKKPRLLYRLGLSRRPFAMACDYRGDGPGTKNKSRKFLEDKAFIAAWDETARLVYAATGTKLPDIRWRAHLALWAARQGLHKEGDFVELGVHTGILSGVICRALDWHTQNRTFWLFDTWAGIPTDNLPAAEQHVADSYNTDYHRRDLFDSISAAFRPFDNCRLVRGFLPDTLGTVTIDKIAYLSIDLNNATYEKACIEVLWPRLVPGAIVVLDDYNFTKCRIQQEMWDDFARDKGLMIASLPTGQGLLIKP